MKSYELTRSIPSEDLYDVVVIGGGPAGTAAAIQAARSGAKTLLVEALGCLGGMGTSALVSQWTDTSDHEKMIVGGIIKEWILKMYEMGGLAPGVDERDWVYGQRNSLGFNPEHLKRLLDQECLDAGVELRFFTKLIDVEMDETGKQVKGVVLHSTEGYTHVPGRCFIDATGNAYLSIMAGAKVRIAGKDTPNIMPPTLCSMVAGVDFETFNRRTMSQPAVEKAVEEGYFSQPDKHVPGLFRSGATWGTLNAGHLFATDAMSQRSLSDAMIWGRKLAEEYTRFHREYLPGCENAVNIGTATTLGVRESTRIVGEYEVNYDDYKARREFPDQIAKYKKQVDIHVYDLSEEEYQRYYKEFNEMDVLGSGESYGLPYGILVPKGYKNLWAAGRCNSSDIKVNGAIRDQPACAMMGQAAGLAAIQVMREDDQWADSLNTATLIESLRDVDAFLPQEELSTEMTRG